jgi:hypothetical protein
MLSLLREHRLVRSRLTGDLEELEIYHRRIRDVVLGEMTTEQFRQAHHNLAESFGEAGANREAVGWHLQMSQLQEIPLNRLLPTSSGRRRRAGSTSPT